MLYTWISRWFVTWTFSLMILYSQTACVYADNAKQTVENKQVIMIFVDGMSFTDLSRLITYPHVHNLLPKAGYGALTLRPVGQRNDPSAYLMSGSGGQALYTERSGTAYQWDEMYKEGVTAGQWYSQLNGSAHLETPIQDSIVFPGINRLLTENQDKPYNPSLGLLGSSIRQAGLIVSVYGNADTLWERKRNAALFAMDQYGRIGEGDVSKRCLQQEAAYPYGIRTDYPYLAKRILQENRSGLHVVELGDLARLYSLRTDTAPLYFNRLYAQILGEMDSFIGTILANQNPGQLVMLLSVNPNDQSQKEKSLLTPLLTWKNGQPSGVLTSQTTRQSGVANGLDLLPTILDWLQIPVPPQSIGYPITTDPSVPSTFPQFMLEIERINHIYQNRPTILYIYVMLQIFTLVLASVIWIWRKRVRTSEELDYRRAIRLWLLAMLFFPALFLLEPIMLANTPPLLVLGVIVLLAFGGALLVERLPFPQLLLAVAGFTTVCILIDGFTGAKAMSRSYMGYDPVIAARFYGLGNEYEGVLIGSMILLVSALYEGWRRRGARCLVLGSCLFAFVLFYMAYPTLGTNAGGFLAGMVGFGITLFRLQEWHLGKKGLLYVGGGLGVGILILVWLHVQPGQPTTHIGRVAHDILNGNWTQVVQIIERKLQMNLRLIRISAWSKVFVVSLLVIGLLSLRPQQFLKTLSLRYPTLVRGFGGIIAGSIATLILNDSGIVSAATSIIFFVIPVLYAALMDAEGEASQG
ncbi:hypothetical protein ACQCN2_21820 [Brevibacillus ginsengisoli]|uniref:hypothetical protein n=1 Tax=Brevibacillus ginsengisoli TaxID=363854 RepID=UPI003CF2C0A8